MTILDRYVLGRFLRILPVCIGAAALLFLMVDFFQRVGQLASYEANASQVAAYFLFKLPRTLTEVYPAGCLLSVLLGIGGLADGGELLAIRACGVGTARLLRPLVIAGLVTGLVVLAWNETVVPPCYTRARLIRDVGIEKELQSGLFNAASIWYRSDQGFVNIGYFDANENVLNEIAVHEPDQGFHAVRLVEVPRASWNGSGWTMESGVVTTFFNGDFEIREAVPGDLRLEATPEELRRKRRRSFEFSYRELERQIANLQDKGLNATEYLVDLRYKLAVPFSGLIAIIIGLPLALRSARRGGGLLRNLVIGLAAALAYWTTTAVAVAAGHVGALPPWTAAWAANVLFGAGGLAMYRRGD